MAKRHRSSPRKREDDPPVAGLAVVPTPAAAPAEVRIPLPAELAWFDELIGQFTQGYAHLLGGALAELRYRCLHRIVAITVQYPCQPLFAHQKRRGLRLPRAL